MALESAEFKGKASTNHKHSTSAVDKAPNCAYCSENHGLYQCETFIKLDVTKRISFVNEKKLCFKCLRANHTKDKCKSKFNCKSCKGKHNSLLHQEKPEFKQQKSKQTSCAATLTSAQEEQPSTSFDSNEELNVSAHLVEKTTGVLLATALISVSAKNGSKILLRALVDQGSQSCFITENAVQLLGLQRKKIVATVTGIGKKQIQAKTSVELTISPRNGNNNFSLTTEAIVIKNIAGEINDETDRVNEWEHLKNLFYADLSFMQGNQQIDVLLGSAEHAKIIKFGLIKGPEDTPVAQNTEFGWIISGLAGNNKSLGLNVASMVVLND